MVDVPAVHHFDQCHDSSGINEGHQPTARATFTNGKPRFQKLLEPLDLQLITPEVKGCNLLTVQRKLSSVSSSMARVEVGLKRLSTK